MANLGNKHPIFSSLKYNNCPADKFVWGFPLRYFLLYTVAAIKPDRSAQKTVKKQKNASYVQKKTFFKVYTNIQWWPPSSQWLQPASWA